jgi:hypothetical protein
MLMKLYEGELRPSWFTMGDEVEVDENGAIKDLTNKFEPNTPDWSNRQFELQHGITPDATPTTLKQARELGYFGNDLAKFEDADPFLSSLFQSKGLNEQQAVSAAIQGKQAHQDRFGQGYTTASSLSGIFNDFIFPAAGVAPDQRLETLPGWSGQDAAARGKAAADIEHGGDFGSATGLGQILSFQSNLGGNILEAWKKDPERALLGFNTPLESSIGGAITGKDYRPTVDMYGGATKYDSQSAQEKGIDTQSGEAMHQIARMLVAKFAMSGGPSAGGASAGGADGNILLADSGQTMTDVSPGLNEGNGMWDWLDGIEEPVNFQGGGGGDFFNGYDSSIPYTDETGAFDMYGSNSGAPGGQPGSVFDYQSPNTNILDYLKQYGQKGLDLFSKLKGLAGAGGIAGAVGGAVGKNSTGGGILGNILNDPLGAAFNATPFLLALNEANRQGGDLNNVIGKINTDSYRKAVLDPFDLETGQGRAAMLSDLGQRGVAGSSFGYQALNNYDYSRNLARSDMASKADLASAGLEGQLINQRNTNRNLLLGAGLNASGRLFSPQQDPFDLKKLLGL